MYCKDAYSTFSFSLIDLLHKTEEGAEIRRELCVSDIQ